MEPVSGAGAIVERSSGFQSHWLIKLEDLSDETEHQKHPEKMER